ncbi:hypothetical protein ABTD15_19485, partial [Acinetobacter baumannii]
LGAHIHHARPPFGIEVRQILHDMPRYRNLLVAEDAFSIEVQQICSFRRHHRRWTERPSRAMTDHSATYPSGARDPAPQADRNRNTRS